MRAESLIDVHMSIADFDQRVSPHTLSISESELLTVLPSQDQDWSVQQIKSCMKLIRILCLQDKFAEARSYLDICREKISKILGSDKDSLSLALEMEQGRYFCLSKFPARALDSFQKVWTQAEALQDNFHSVDAAFMLAITLPLKKGRSWFERALEIAKNTQDAKTKKWLPQLYITEAWYCFDSLQLDLALENLDHAEKSTGQDEFLKIQINWSKGRVLRAKGEFFEALKIQEKILTEMDDSQIEKSFVYLEIGECWQGLQETDKARPFLETALERLKNDKWYSDNHKFEIERVQKNSTKKW